MDDNLTILKPFYLAHMGLTHTKMERASGHGCSALHELFHTIHALDSMSPEPYTIFTYGL